MRTATPLQNERTCAPFACFRLPGPRASDDGRYLQRLPRRPPRTPVKTSQCPSGVPWARFLLLCAPDN